jgi:sulfiredoxin
MIFHPAAPFAGMTQTGSMGLFSAAHQRVRGTPGRREDDRRFPVGKQALGANGRRLASLLPSAYTPGSRTGDSGQSRMMKKEKFPIADIYVPVKRRATLKPETVQEIAQSMLENGQQTPILVRRDGARFVLVEGLHRLEACKALGEETIFGYLVQAAKH